MQPGPLLMPDEVVHHLFTSRRFGTGYDQDQVDNWLDEVVATMRGHIANAPVAQPVRSSDLASLTFAETRFRDGYDQQEVDAFVDRVHATLVALESGQRPG